MPRRLRHRLSSWRVGWRGVAIDMRSPLPIEEARARLQAALTSRWSSDPGSSTDRRPAGPVGSGGRSSAVPAGSGGGSSADPVGSGGGSSADPVGSGGRSPADPGGSDRPRRGGPGGSRGLWAMGRGGSGDRRVVGRVREDGRVRVEGRYAMVRNSWRPVARGALRPEGTGCRLTGTLRAPWPVLIFSAIWLGGVGVFFLIGLLATIAALATGHAREAGGPAAVAAAGAGLFGFGAGLVGVGVALGRRDGDFLLDWLAGELEVGGYGGPSRSRPPE